MKNINNDISFLKILEHIKEYENENNNFNINETYEFKYATQLSQNPLNKNIKNKNNFINGPSININNNDISFLKILEHIKEYENENNNFNIN